MVELSLIPEREFARVRDAALDDDARLALIADMCRLNALTAVKRAGSGHLGSSFSAMDIVVLLLWELLDTVERGFDNPDRDVYFSSKGHDVPGLYAVLHSLGVVPAEKLLRLRRFGGLDGHPNVRVPGSRRTPARSAWASRRAAASRGRSGISGVADASSSWSATGSCRRARTGRRCRRRRTRGSAV